MNTKNNARFTSRGLACGDTPTFGIFDGEAQIGQYVRDYHSFNPFYAFERDGKWYALYSPTYTCTRLMSLPDCIDIGGEEDEDGFGFCPVEFFVPQVFVQHIKEGDTEPINPRRDEKWCTTTITDGIKMHSWPGKDNDEWVKACEIFDREYDAWYDRNKHIKEYAPFGFVAGCHWGDDTSWKIQYIDLSNPSSGQVVRDDRFGYIELPRHIDLCDAVDMRGYDRHTINLAVSTRFKISGEKE